MNKNSALTKFAPQNATEAEECAVYDALIKDLYMKYRFELIVTSHETELDRSNKSSDIAAGIPRGDLQLIDEIISDFVAKNEQPRPLKPLFNLGIPHPFISDQELKEIFQTQEGWNGFYAKYPGAQGIMTLSRIGFDRQMREALVYVGNQGHWLAGAGFFVTLRKENSTWIIQKQIMTWIS